MFFDLLRAEVVRLTYRRRATWSVVLMLLIGILLPTQWMPGAAALTAAERAEAQSWLASDQAAGYCTEGCHLDDYLRSVLTFRDVTDNIADAGLFVALVVFLIAVTYVASDFASGALATQLTFTPRRPAVLAARTLGASLLGAVLMALATVTSISVSVVWFLGLRGFGSIGDGDGLLDAIWSASLYGAMIGGIAALLVFILGSVVLAGGAAMTVLIMDVVVESYYWPATAGWPFHVLPIRQAVALLTGESDYSYDTLNGSILRSEAVGYHLVVIALLAVIAVVVFNRRDVRS